MTREQEIKKQAEKKALEPSRLMHPYAKQYKVMSAYEIGFIEGAWWADEHPHWISVEDEMPEDNVEVLTINKFNFPVVCYRFRGYWFSRHGNEYVGITHWMPLPEAPKEGGEK